MPVLGSKRAASSNGRAAAAKSRKQAASESSNSSSSDAESFIEEASEDEEGELVEGAEGAPASTWDILKVKKRGIIFFNPPPSGVRHYLKFDTK